MFRVKKNDLVQVLSGQDKGKRGEVIEILPKKGKVKVKGVSLQKIHKKQSRVDSGGIKKQEGFIDLSNVMPVCRSTEKPSRVRVNFFENGKKQRVSVRSGEIL